MFTGKGGRLFRGCALSLAAIMLSACATTAGLLGMGVEQTTQTQRAEQCESDRAKPLARWSTISGTLLGESDAAGSTQATRTQRVRLLSPVSVAVQSNYVFIADAGARVIYRFDRALQTVRVFAQVPDMSPDARIRVDRALSVYLADPSRAGVIQFDLDGRVLQSYKNANHLTRPVAVAIDDARGELFAADGLAARVLAFNRAGTLSHSIGSSNAVEQSFGSIGAMALSADQLFVADTLTRKVHALSATGAYRYHFGSEELQQPVALAIDEWQRVYVADDGDNTIKVYRGGRFEAVVGAPGDAAGLGFHRIQDLTVQDGHLYIADTGSATVQILRIKPPCP